MSVNAPLMGNSHGTDAAVLDGARAVESDREREAL